MRFSVCYQSVFAPRTADSSGCSEFNLQGRDWKYRLCLVHGLASGVDRTESKVSAWFRNKGFTYPSTYFHPLFPFGTVWVCGGYIKHMSQEKAPRAGHAAPGRLLGADAC